MLAFIAVSLLLGLVHFSVLLVKNALKLLDLVLILHKRFFELAARRDSLHREFLFAFDLSLQVFNLLFEACVHLGGVIHHFLLRGVFLLELLLGFALLTEHVGEELGVFADLLEFAGQKLLELVGLLDLRLNYLLQGLSLLLFLFVAAVEVGHLRLLILFLTAQFLQFVLQIHILLLQAVDLLRLVVQFVALRIIFSHDFTDFLVFVLKTHYF